MAGFSQRQAVFAEQEVLSTFGCSRRSSIETERPAQQLVHPSGWVFSSDHQVILNKKQLEKLAEKIAKNLSSQTLANIDHQKGDDTIKINGYDLHIPPMIFANDLFRLSFGTLSLKVDAGDALQCWVAQHTPEAEERSPIRIVKVPYAVAWQKSLADNLRMQGEDNIIRKKKACDWTFSSDYCITACSGVSEAVLGGHSLAQMRERGHGSHWSIQVTDNCGIDFDLLRRQDVPILFFDEMILYQVS